MKPATSNLASSWGLPRPIIKSHPQEKVGWPWARGAPQNFGVTYNISARLGLTTSNLASCWGLPRPIIKSHAEERVNIGLG